MNILLIACLVAGAPVGLCRAEVAAGAILDDFPPQPPGWATEAWQDFAAHIVASEARNVPAADIVVACTLARDVERGWPPRELDKRWYGCGQPDVADRQAVRDALVTDACNAVPDYKFVGNIRDVQHWRAIGMIGDGPFDLYVGATGSTVVGIQW